MQPHIIPRHKKLPILKNMFYISYVIEDSMKQNCFSLFHCWQKIMSRVTTMLNLVHKTFYAILTGYKGSSIIGGSWPRSPTRMMDLPPKWQFFFSGNASRNRASICIKNLDPRKLISSINIYLTCCICSWNTASDYPCSGCISLIGIFRADCIVFAYY